MLSAYKSAGKQFAGSAESLKSALEEHKRRNLLFCLQLPTIITVIAKCE